MSPLEHSAILLTFIKKPFVIKIFVLSFFEWQFYKGFTVVCFENSVDPALLSFLFVIHNIWNPASYLDTN